jgi:cytokinin dehydrogenase
MDWIADLATKIEGIALKDEASRAGVASDFGRIVERKPAVVVRSASTRDVAEVVKFAACNSLHVTARGAGHSQSGQSLSDQIVLDMRSLDQILDLDERNCIVRCQAGITWRSLLERLLPLGLSPPVLTNNLDVTVGGTLSTAGVGVASWRYGAQADHCLELEAVTGEGEILRSSPTCHRDLFDALRAGLGQCGVITEVHLELRRHQPRVCTFYLLYDDLQALLGDLKALIEEARFDYLESWCVPLPQGMRKIGGERQPFAQWFFPLHAAVEFSGGTLPDASGKLRGLNFYKHVHTEESSIAEFFTRLDPLFALWKRGGFWDYAHPWMECILPWQAAPFYISQVLQNFPPQALAGGHILLWPARRSASSVPFFILPEGEAVMGFGILPAVPKALLGEALPRLERASKASIALGAKRYLSGWFDFNTDQWKAHYGDMWQALVDLKRKYDPKAIFNPDFRNY